MSWLVARLEREGSTRAVGLLRVLLGLAVWSRFAREVAPFTDASPARVVLAAAFFVGTTAMVFGWRTRIATAFTGALLWAMVFGFGRVGGYEPWTHHHTTLLAVAVALLALTPCGRSFSVDRYLAVGRARAAGEAPPPERGPLWATDLLGLQVATVYFWSAVDKTSWAFLSGMRLEQLWMHHYSGSEWPELPLVQALCATMAVAVVGLEYALPFGLWVPRLQRWLIPAGLVLHGLFYVLLPVKTFTVTMWALYLVFLDPEAVHRAVDRLLDARGSA